MTRIASPALALVGLLFATAAPVAAQDSVDRLLRTPTATPPAAEAPVNDGEADIQATDDQQDPEELRVTRALNAEITARNELAAAQERAEQAAFEAERARHEAEAAEILRQRLAWEESVRAADEARRRWDADRARWEADTRACQDGDRSRCARPN
ncbi:cell wall hydrolase [Brevundimonas aurifodinae]|uniref:Cell wall hydrolase n=2 Tax=Brevundimonas TaxID=41275 RepID=A0ABV1NLB0_9CAUL|nr:MAG: hypothetical protein B7Z42_03175 [Brevundimonas sp. 12-68-7]OYX34754.1 MAG: hypothetical protein B7Z01_04205 [Brevundimonas subvibrioides]